MEKKGDYTPDAILTGYKCYVKKFINLRVCLNLSRMNMRYAGPRESLFHAVIRRNYGCTIYSWKRSCWSFNFYKKYEAHELAKRFGKELNIKIMKLCGPFYCKICDGIVTGKTCNHPKKNILIYQEPTLEIFFLKKGS